MCEWYDKIMIKDYCTQNGGDCKTCSLVNYGRDCQNEPLEKETAYGSWADFEKATGMTKQQYQNREKKIAEDLAEKEVDDSIFK